MPSALPLSSLSGSGTTSLNWSQTLNWSQLQQLRPCKQRAWRKRVGVEPTTRLAKSRIAGFEGREDHRIPFASAKSIEARCGWRQTWRSDGFESERRPNRKERVPYRPRSRNVLTGFRVFHPEVVREPFPCEAREVRPFLPLELRRKKA